MENGGAHGDVATETAADSSPPPPPDPNVDDATAATLAQPAEAKSDEPLQLDSEEWDITSVSALGALRMLIAALEELAVATGDVPPTPPVSRPTTPRKPGGPRHFRRPSATPSRATSAEDLPSLPIGSPEAHPQEPITVEVGPHAADVAFQHAAIARRFFSRVAPPFTLREYLLRLHHWCPHSPGVYLAAAVYTYELCVGGSAGVVPATARTIHRLSLAAIRIAAKSLEDNKWTQDRVAKVGGISNAQLMNLEVTLCYLLDFNLRVDARAMATQMFRLQQAATQGFRIRKRLSDRFELRLPTRPKKEA